MIARMDPTFHATAKLAMEAAPEAYTYTVMLSPDFSQPDGLCVVDVNPKSSQHGKIVHTVMMPNKSDEFHHFGWNACSSVLSPLTGHAFLERRYLIVPGIRSSRIYVIDTKPDPRRAKIHKIIEPEKYSEVRLFPASHSPLRTGGSVSVHARSQFLGRFCSGVTTPGGRGSKADGMRRLRWGSDFGAA